MSDLFAVRASQPAQYTNPFSFFGAARASFQSYINWLSGIQNPGRAGTTVQVAIDQVAATDTLTFAAVASTGVGGTINGVACTATATDLNGALTAEALKSAINANSTLAALVLATRSLKVVTVTALAQGTTANSYGLTGATGVTRSGANMTGGVYATGKVLFAAATSGNSGATIDGTLIEVAYNASIGQTATDFAAAVDADATIGPKTTTSVSGSTVTITWTVAESPTLANATPLVASGQATVSGATIGTVAGGAVAGVAASGTFTVSSTVAVGRLTSVVNGTTVAFAASTADDDATAALVLAKILAGGNTPNNLVSKNVTATLQTAVAATGWVNFSSGAGVIGAVLNGTAITVTWATSDAATASAWADAVNASLTLNGLITATYTSGNPRVTVTAALPGTAGNSLTLAVSGAGTGQSVSGTTLTGGLGTVITTAAKVPGYSGNTNSLVAAGTGTTAATALFTGGLETLLDMDVG